ncbi:MAG TPA: ABC transporter permease subunit [Myxococcaceae bacterium]|nr:ABC transporter permease subunit [Myxococcaceae bacterium]
MLTREVRILFGKEWRQLLRSRSAMLTALFLPVLMLVVVPGIQMMAVSAGEGVAGANVPRGMTLPPGLEAMRDDPRAMLRAVLPAFIALGGLIVPAVTASYTLISERESRTLELLVALPVRVGQILLAKLLALLALAGLVTLVLFSIDAGLILVLGLGSVGYVLALLSVLLSALAFSTTAALLVSLLARDFRTSNNLNGVLIGPTIIACFSLIMALPSPTLAALVIAALFTVGAGVSIFVAMKLITFERLLR